MIVTIEGGGIPGYYYTRIIRIQHMQVWHNQIPATYTYSKTSLTDHLHRSIIQHMQVLHNQIPATYTKTSLTDHLHRSIIQRMQVLHNQIPATYTYSKTIRLYRPLCFGPKRSPIKMF